jgi:hypothetical protein
MVCLTAARDRNRQTSCALLLWSRGQHAESETALASGPGRAGPGRASESTQYRGDVFISEPFRGANGYPELGKRLSSELGGRSVSEPGRRSGSELGRRSNLEIERSSSSELSEQYSLELDGWFTLKLRERCR